MDCLSSLAMTGASEGGLRMTFVSATMRLNNKNSCGSSLDMPILKKLLCSAAVLGLGIAAAPRNSGKFPNGALTLVIPFAPGGSTTTVATGARDKMGKLLGETDGRADSTGAGGKVG